MVVVSAIMITLGIMYFMGFSVGEGLAIFALIQGSISLLAGWLRWGVNTYGDDVNHPFWVFVKENYESIENEEREVK